MRNYFGPKFRMGNSESQAMSNFKAIILHCTVLQRVGVLLQKRGIATFPKAPG